MVTYVGVSPRRLKYLMGFGGVFLVLVRFFIGGFGGFCLVLFCFYVLGFVDFYSPPPPNNIFEVTSQ